MSALYEITNSPDGSGLFMMGIAGETLEKHKLVYRAADSTWHLSDANATTTMIVYGITLGEMSIGSRGKILLSGYVGGFPAEAQVGDPAHPAGISRGGVPPLGDPAHPDGLPPYVAATPAEWAWTVGGEAGLIYASGIPGELTQTPPALPGDTVQGVAIALDANSMLFSPPGYMGAGGGTTEPYWYNGAGAPGAGVGVNGDYYLDVVTNELYEKAGGVWAVIATLGGGGVSVIQTFPTTIDLHQGAGTYDVATAVGQDVLIKSLVFSPRLDVSDDATITYVTFQTDTTTPQTFIDAAGGAKALLTAEAQIDWVGSVILRVGDKIQFTIAGGSADVNPTTCDVVVEFMTLTAGGSLA